MAVSRREFTQTAGALVALAVLGCEKKSEPDNPPAAGGAPAEGPGGGGRGGGANRANLATEPFRIGPRQAFAAAGVYETFKQDKGVWVVSDGAKLAVLSATCTHTGCTTRWDGPNKQYVCPCHNSRFGADGENIGNAKAKRPLERCAVRLVTGEREEIEVDPTRRFRKENGGWEDPASSLVLG